MKGKIISVIIMLLLGWGIYSLLFSKPKASGMVLYYGDTCPHCETLRVEMKKEGLFKKFGIQEKEVYQDKGNHDELVSRAAICGIDQNNLGVPLLWNGNGCVFGNEQIKDYLKKIDEK